jgi:hypothetical protein
MAELGISIPSPADLLPGGDIDVRRVHPRGIHDGGTWSEFSALDELTSARVLGRLLYAVAGPIPTDASPSGLGRLEQRSLFRMMAV